MTNFKETILLLTILLQGSKGTLELLITFETSMHFPFSISIGTYSVSLHGIFEFLAFFIAFRYFIYLRKKQTDIIDTNNRTWIIIGATFGALIGSRLVGGLEDIHQLKTASNKFLYFYQNKTVLGGFLGGLLGVEWVKKIIHVKDSSGDLFTFPMILGLIIGRIGCFSMGIYEETYGTKTDLFTGMNLGDGLMRHPVALYEILFLLMLWFLLVQTEKKYSLAAGARFKIFMIFYILFRFLLDFIKPHYNIIFNLSSIQLFSLAGLIYYYSYIINPKKLLLTNPSI